MEFDEKREVSSRCSSSDLELVAVEVPALPLSSSDVTTNPNPSSSEDCALNKMDSESSGSIQTSTDSNVSGEEKREKLNEETGNTGDQRLDESTKSHKEEACDSREITMEANLTSITSQKSQPSCEKSAQDIQCSSTEPESESHTLEHIVCTETKSEESSSVSNPDYTPILGGNQKERMGETVQEAPLVTENVVGNNVKQTVSVSSHIEKDELRADPSAPVLKVQGDCVERTEISGVSGDKTDDSENSESGKERERRVNEPILTIALSPGSSSQTDRQVDGNDLSTSEDKHTKEMSTNDTENLTQSKISESHAGDILPRTTCEGANIDETSNMSSEDVECMAHADPDDENVEDPIDSTSPNEDPFCSKPTEKVHNTAEELDQSLGLIITSVESQEDSSASVVGSSTSNVVLSADKTCSTIVEDDDNSSSDVTPIEDSAGNEAEGKTVEERMECDALAETLGTQGVEFQSDSEMIIDSQSEDKSKNDTDQQKSAAAEMDDVMIVDDNPSTNSKADTEEKRSTETRELPDVAVSELLADSKERTQNSNDLQEREKQSATKAKDTLSADQDLTLIGDKSIEEICIVPDASPKAVSVKDKSSNIAEESPATNSEKNAQKDDLESVSEEASCTNAAENSSHGKDEANKNSDSSHKTGIQLVSTSSLISRPEMVDKSGEDSDVLELSSSQDDVQAEGGVDQACAECSKVTQCKYKVKKPSGAVYLCVDACYTKYKETNEAPLARATIRPRKLDRAFVHKCGQCSQKVDTTLEKSLSWETMDFCNEDCLETYQRTLGSHCANCNAYVQSVSLGKYCVRFGYDMKQFCTARCLEDFKKGLKVCSYCQKDISSGPEGFLAPVGDKGQFKDFCTQECMGKYEQMSNNTVAPEVTHECAVCNEKKAVKVEILLDSKVQQLCSEPCFAAFKFVNKIVADKCDMCKKYYDHDRSENFSVFYDEAPHSFCCKTCMNVYILAKRKIVPCSSCKVKKYNFDMIKKAYSGQAVLMLCSLHCLEIYQAAQPAGANKKGKCEHCSSSASPQYHLTMSDATVRNFCSGNCVVAFQAKFPKTAVGGDKALYPLGVPRRVGSKKPAPGNVAVSENELSSCTASTMPVISSVTSLAPTNNQIASTNPVPSPGPIPPSTTPASLSGISTNIVAEPVKTVFKQQFILRPPPRPDVSNCAVQVKPLSASKGVSCRPESCTVGTQTDVPTVNPVLIPVPVPIYIPAPMHMYSVPYPVPVPIVLPVPVPFFIPTTRNSAKGILKEIKHIQEKIPSDPFEAELLMMAEMVAGEKKGENTDSDSGDSEGGGKDADDSDVNDAGSAAEPDFTSEHVDTNNTFGDDVLQMALKMASDFDDPPVAFESSVGPTSVSQTGTTQAQAVEPKNDSDGDDTESEPITQSSRKRTADSSSRSSSTHSKRIRKSSSPDQLITQQVSEPKSCPKEEEPVEKPDANMCLKFTFGVNAWRNWVNLKNAELEKEKASSPAKRIKLFKPELLQLTSDELNYYLCHFVKEVRKPTGEKYTPDTLYYLCLGIQQYFIENGRIENIFTDPYYEKFTDSLDEAAQEFPLVHSDSQYLVTRIEEEHLWESKQLGAHSPYVLLNTLMFFHSKHFNLMTVEEHMQLSFSHIMKHWKRNLAVPPGTKGLGGTRNVLLRFYPPPSVLAANSKKKKVYEQQEDEENPLRCPVKLYEFYLSKCPESVKTRNDVFYLLPERSCVPDSPVWYSTMSLGQEQLQKMLHRIKMVKEIAMI